MTRSQDWVQRAQSADRAERNIAFDHLVRDYQGMVYAIARGRLRDEQLAEDAAQDAFLIAYKQISQLRDVSAFPAWLKRIALTQVDRVTRRAGPPQESIDAREDLPAGDASPEEQLAQKELRQRLRLAVAALPDTQRHVTSDYYLRGASQREISEELNIPLATVKKRLQYARKRLRHLITGFNESLDRAIYGEPLPPSQGFQPEAVPVRARRGRHPRQL